MKVKHTAQSSFDGLVPSNLNDRIERCADTSEQFPRVLTEVNLNDRIESLSSSAICSSDSCTNLNDRIERHREVEVVDVYVPFIGI